MKTKLTILLLFFAVTVAFSQSQYPLRTIKEIQYVPDSLVLQGKDASLHVGDTVRVKGIVMASSIVSVNPYNYKRLMWAGDNRYNSYLYDSAGTGEWSGINIIVNDSVTGQSIYMDLIDTCQLVTVTGVVTEYLNKYTELVLLPNYPIDFGSTTPKRPEPIELKISDFATGTTPNALAEKYENAYVIIRNVISSDRNTSTSAANPFSIIDQNGNKIAVHGQSCYFTKRTYKMRSWDPPIDGSSISYIRGIMGQNSDGTFVIRPIYPDDMLITTTPCIIGTVKRDADLVKPNQPVVITTKITDNDGYVQSAKLIYKVNGQNRTVINMTKTTADTTIYTATIPGISADSAMVDFYILAKDNDNQYSTNPVDTTKGNYLMQVLKRSLTIQDVQYSPLGSGYSAYNNYKVTISGVITADTTDLQGDGNTVARRVHMQNGSGPWSGIWIYGLATDTLYRGYNVTLSGTIDESNGTTRLDTITSVVVNSKNNPLPDPVLIGTRIANLTNGDVNAEQWESVLVKYKDVTVTSENADGNPGPYVTGNNNYGEILVADTSNVGSRVELQEGNHPYNNNWDTLVVKTPGNIQIKKGDQFSELRGVFFYEFSEYKLIPRKSDDFVGYKPLSVKEENGIIASNYSLSQNYPNPFNPSTSIRFSIPVSGQVSLKIFDVLGREVKTLLNEEKHAGTYTVSFDMRNLSSGIYFYRLQAGNFMESKKMILMK